MYFTWQQKGGKNKNTKKLFPSRPIQGPKEQDVSMICQICVGGHYDMLGIYCIWIHLFIYYSFIKGSISYLFMNDPKVLLSMNPKRKLKLPK